MIRLTLKFTIPHFRGEIESFLWHGDVKEILPPDMPEPLGYEVILCLYVDANYAGDSINRRSRTALIEDLEQVSLSS